MCIRDRFYVYSVDVETADDQKILKKVNNNNEMCIRDSIILDEAQNTTPAQMKMFLTRIGFGSKAVITGDATQKDLTPGTALSLIHILRTVISY